VQILTRATTSPALASLAVFRSPKGGPTARRNKGGMRTSADRRYNDGTGDLDAVPRAQQLLRHQGDNLQHALGARGVGGTIGATAEAEVDQPGA
jgi:hypothetical protein